VEKCSLWIKPAGENPECLVPEGELNLEKLSESRLDGFGAVHYLRFIDPLNLAELASYRLKNLRGRGVDPKFRAGRGRLARVGYGSRFVDALFSISLLARGRVPGDTAASATITYQQMRTKREHFQYYGRVLRKADWIVLQYWYFYPFNNWRTGFYGVNDHESDWEMACIYLYEQNGEILPEWVAYACHDFSGDDLRRRWDDPELDKVGEHPIIYAGAGSHAAYFSPGEYLAEVEIPFLSPLVRLVDFIVQSWRKILRNAQGREDTEDSQPEFNFFRIPFVDYARGDGLSIGVNGDKPWQEPQLLEPPPPWVAKYRGLWGLYARDPIAGEDAPAGPMYDRDGTVRQAWYDPLGWAGLDKVVPPSQALPQTINRKKDIEAEHRSLSAEISEKHTRLLEMGIEAEAMRSRPHLKDAYFAHIRKIKGLTEEIDHLRAKLAAEESLIDALEYRLVRLRRGDRGSPRAHIKRPHSPESESGLRLSQFAEAWAAISIGLMVFAFMGILLFARKYLIPGLVALITLVILVETGFRRQLSQLITSLTIGLAVVSALILCYEFFWETVVVVVLVAGIYIVWENLRELWG
jgi:hypothetical protein